MAASKEMTFLDHLGELRRRLTYSLIAVAVFFLVSWCFARSLFRFLELPIKPYLSAEQPMFVFTELAMPFITYLKVALLFGILFASPVILWQVWKFISPGLYATERYAALPFLFGTTVFFLLGCAFGYAVAFPRVCEFLLSVGTDFRPMLTVDKYLSLMSKIVLGLGLVFEIPVLTYFLARLGIVTAGLLVRWWRFVVVGIFLTAAVLTPTPDIATQLVFAVPMLILYVLSIGIAWSCQKKSS
jgi:sec-independent protein translocase protein TatC